MKNTLETRLGIFVALAVIAAVLILETLGGIEHFRRGYHLKAQFNNVQELKVGDRVKLAGVEVGRIEDIELVATNNKVCVTFKVNKKTLVRTDSTATIKYTGLMGQNFIALDFGTPQGQPATDGTYLTAAEQPDLGAILQKLDNVAGGVENLTKSFTGFKIDDLVGPLISLVKDTKTNLTLTISNVAAITSQVRSGEGTVGKLIYSDSLYNTAASTVSNLDIAGAEIKLTVAEARKVVDEINAGQGTIGRLVKDEKLYNETTEAMTNLKEIMQKVNRGQGTVGKLINDQELLDNAKLTLQKLDKATESLEDQGPLSVMGIVVGRLF